MPKLKICLVSPPYSGHLNPILALGRELMEIADITVISTPSAMASATAAGLDTYPILKEAESIVAEIASPGRSVKSNPLLLYRQLKANVSLQSDLLRELELAFARLKPDLVIADFTLPVSGVAAVRHGARWWTTLPSPCVFETRDGPAAYFGGLSPATSWPGHLRDFALRGLTRLFKRIMFFIFRSSFQKAGLSSVYRADGSERVYSPEKIIASSIAELEFASGYPDHFVFAGPLLYTPPQPRSEQPEFIAGCGHILITLGSHQAHHKDSLAETMRELARMHPGWIFHFTDGDPDSNRVHRDENFHRHGFIRYDELLPRYDLVVHHGGMGVLLHCLTHGIPAIVLPMDFDQFDYAARLADKGLAYRVRSPRQIGEVLPLAVADQIMAHRCRTYRDLIAAYQPGPLIREMVTAAFADL